MSSSSLYWPQNLVRGFGFGRMRFLKVPQQADSSDGGKKLLGSVVREFEGKLFNGGIIGKDYPGTTSLAEPALFLTLLEKYRKELGISENESLVKKTYLAPHIKIEKKDALKVGVDELLKLPILGKIEHSRMERIVITFGKNTCRHYIQQSHLRLLKEFFNGDDRKITDAINIDRETIINEILLTDAYSVTFESVSSFDSDFEASINQANLVNPGKFTFELDRTTKKQMTVSVNDGYDYLIALNNTDWDDF